MTEQAPPLEAEGMTLLEHVRELRNRVFIAVIALAVGTGISFTFSERILQFLISPYGDKLLATSPLEALTNVFTVSLTAGAIFAMPIILWQIFGFIAPGLLPKEKKWIFFGLPFALILFAMGVSFAWFIMLPAALGFLTGIFPGVFNVQLRPDEYIPFVTGILFWMGVAFEMPMIIFILAKAGVVSSYVLRKQWRFAVVIIAVIAAVITPTPDPVNMSIVMVPLLILYVFSIFMASLARRGAQSPALLDPEELDRK
jgi:sec-independent protein translocase protein TatC